MVNGSLILNNGKKIIINRSYKSVPDYTVPSVFKIGINNSTPNTGDTDLDNPVAITGTEAVDDCETANWTDDAEMTSTLNSTTFKEGSNSLSLEKDAGASSTCSISKTTTSIDFTDKTLFVWLNITDVTDLIAAGTAVTIRFGSDAANYYQKDFDITSLSNGWNLLYFTSATADSTTGAPVIGSMDYSYLAYFTDNAADLVAADRIMMDDWKVASTDDFTKTFVAGYPIIDETNFETEIRCQLLSTEANGYDINGIGLFNTDGTPLMSEEDTFTAESKSSTDQFTFIIKNRII